MIALYCEQWYDCLLNSMVIKIILLRLDKTWRGQVHTQSPPRDCLAAMFSISSYEFSIFSSFLQSNGQQRKIKWLFYIHVFFSCLYHCRWSCCEKNALEKYQYRKHARMFTMRSAFLHLRTGKLHNKKKIFTQSAHLSAFTMLIKLTGENSKRGKCFSSVWCKGWPKTTTANLELD